MSARRRLAAWLRTHSDIEARALVVVGASGWLWGYMAYNERVAAAGLAMFVVGSSTLAVTFVLSGWRP